MRSVTNLSTRRPTVNRKAAEKINPIIQSQTQDTLDSVAELVRDLGWLMVVSEEAHSEWHKGANVRLGRMHLIAMAIAAAVDYENDAIANRAQDLKETANG